MITASVEQQIKNHAVREYPHESVGLVLLDNTYLPVKNVHSQPTHHFKIETTTFQQYLPLLKAIVHSHPNQQVLEPSLDDQQLIVSYKTTGGICRVLRDVDSNSPQASSVLWWGKHPNQAPSSLEGRAFVYGVTDCFGLVRDWYYLNRGVTLYDIPRTYGWWDDPSHPCWNLIENSIELLGFKRAKYQSHAVNPGDVILMSLRSKWKNSNHIALYEGGDSIIHHLPATRGSLRASLSRRDTLSRWANYITGVAKWVG
ncbi:conserved hypothetical protein [Candidatus Defluviicoccus seviourii]|uniref:NlpC/P60 domain-containing protein n=1 Tax=Candidatus Defluviicoccus seviourii TaxID=2565273 RepID=A0A564WJK0_9PROT|nr:conserved hypothetical protein [Candidatus Defluviicoccus seviourii]